MFGITHQLNTHVYTYFKYVSAWKECNDLSLATNRNEVGLFLKLEHILRKVFLLIKCQWVSQHIRGWREPFQPKELLKCS